MSHPLILGSRIPAHHEPRLYASLEYPPVSRHSPPLQTSPPMNAHPSQTECSGERLTACGFGGIPRSSESRSEAERERSENGPAKCSERPGQTASRRLPTGRAKRGNFVESHGGPMKCEIRSARAEVQPARKSKFAARHFPTFVIRNSSFDIPPTFRRDLEMANAEVRIWN